MALQTSINQLIASIATVSGNGVIEKTGANTVVSRAIGTAANNIVALDGTGKIDPALIPSIGLVSVQVVADQSARLALANVEPGDVAKQTDNGISYILQALPASTDSNWVPIGDTQIDAGIDITSGTLPIVRGGTGLSALGAASQQLRVNASATSLEYFTPAPAVVRLPYTELNSNQNLAADNAYGANSATLLVLTLPATAPVGSVIEVTGIGTGLFTIAQGTSQLIHFGNLTTTSGAGNKVTATNRRDTIELVCTVADTEFTVQSAVGVFDVIN